jgi:hypothetical protein
LDELIQQTSNKLKALSDLDATPEKQMAAGMGIEYEVIKSKGVDT